MGPISERAHISLVPRDWVMGTGRVYETGGKTVFANSYHSLQYI